MQTIPQISALDDPDYPSRDGKPLSDNTKQLEWIFSIYGGLDSWYADDPNVMVTADLLWYPVEGDNKIRAAPDAMVIFGRPKGDRGSYIQHREGGVPPRVVFEVLSPGNRAGEMRRKLAFYEKYGAEEYYILDPDFQKHKGYLRDATGTFQPIANLFGWVSPRLGIRFELTRDLIIFRPDGSRFQTYTDVDKDRMAARREAAADREQAAADREQAAADREQAAVERERADGAVQEVERLRAQLRALGIEPEGQV